MTPQATRLTRSALALLHHTGAARLLAPFTGGLGVIFMLHRVSPVATRAFEPNRILRVGPDFLRAVVRSVRANGFDIISMDEVAARLNAVRDTTAGSPKPRPFAAFTLDDGYRDNLAHAYPVFAAEQTPFTVYIPTDYADGRGELWWLALEDVIAAAPAIVVQMQGELRTFPCRSVREKTFAFDEVYWWLRKLPEARAREVVRDLACGIGLDLSRHCRDNVMGWDDLRKLAQDPLVTLGAHTCAHWALSHLNASAAALEIKSSVARIEAEIGKPCRHLSYPYGDNLSAGTREFKIAQMLGLATAVTTRKGLVQAAHAKALTALPRLSLNGDFQDERYVEVLLSGAPFAGVDTVRWLLGARP